MSHAVQRSTTPWRDSSPGPLSCSFRRHCAVLVGFGSFAVSAWQMTARQRRAGARAIIEAPEVFTGRIPRRVRGRSPAALAGYELPMGLLGFPGMGWLFAGFSFTASILLLAGPAVTWAVIPLAFSPFGQGPLSTIGWKVELVWIPATALVSTLLLYRAQRRRRILLEGPRPPAPRRHRGRGYRTRVSIAAGTIVLLLISLPFVPAVAGVGGSSIRYAYQTRFTPDIVGQFLGTRHGPVKLFTWQEPQSPYPADALRVHSADVRALVARAAAVDDPAAYGLYDLDKSTRVSLTRALRDGAAARARATTPLAPGAVHVRRHAPGDVRGPGLRVPHRGPTRRAGDADQLIRERLRASNRGLAPPRCRCSRRLAVRVPPGAIVLAAAGGAKGALGSRLCLLRSCHRVRGRRPASGVEPGALPFVLHRRRSAHRCVPRRGLRLAVASPEGQRRPARRSRGRQYRGGRFRLARPCQRARARDHGQWEAAGQRRAGRACLPVGCRLQLGWNRGPDRRIAVLDRPTPSRQRQRLDRLGRARRRSRDGALAHRRLLARVSRAGRRDRAHVLRVHVRRAKDRAQAGSQTRGLPRQGRLWRDDDRRASPPGLCRGDQPGTPHPHAWTASAPSRRES